MESMEKDIHDPQMIPWKARDGASDLFFLMPTLSLPLTENIFGMERNIWIRGQQPRTRIRFPAESRNSEEYGIGIRILI